MKQKKLLLLGGLRYLIPVIKKAHELGCYVITCDYLPDNIAHKYSDEYHNVSILDKEAVLSLAKKLQIDGIMSFAVDPGVATAAYVADKLGLPSPPYESVKILQDKGLFRAFLKDNGFNVPIASSFSSKITGLNNADLFTYPVIVKPVDSAGSKGVTKINNSVELSSAIDIALNNSHKREYIIEEFIEADGYSSDSDCFSVNNELIVTTFSNQYFDLEAANPYTPAGFSWPSSMSLENQAKLQAELQRLIKLLNLGTSIYNVETRVGKNGVPYIMEVSPRGGGNRLAEMVNFAYGIDLIEMSILGTIGELEATNVIEMKNVNHISELIIHSKREGVFDSIDINSQYKPNLFELDLWVKQGDYINCFNGANDTIGTLVIQSDIDYNINLLTDHGLIYNILLK